MKPKLAPASLLALFAALALVVSPARAAGISLSPASGPAGTGVNVSGSGFTPGTPCSLWWDSVGGTPVGATVAGLLGSISTSIVVPPTSLGQHHVVVDCPLAGESASASFNVTAPPTPKPTKTCEELGNCTPTPLPPTKTCEELNNCTATPLPTATPVPTATPTPTETPLPSASPIPTDTPRLVPTRSPGAIAASLGPLFLVGMMFLGLLVIAGIYVLITMSGRSKGPRPGG